MMTAVPDISGKKRDHTIMSGSSQQDKTAQPVMCDSKESGSKKLRVNEATHSQSAFQLLLKEKLNNKTLTARTLSHVMDIEEGEVQEETVDCMDLDQRFANIDIEREGNNKMDVEKKRKNHFIKRFYYFRHQYKTLSKSKLEYLEKIKKFPRAKKKSQVDATASSLSASLAGSKRNASGAPIQPDSVDVKQVTPELDYPEPFKVMLKKAKSKSKKKAKLQEENVKIAPIPKKWLQTRKIAGETDIKQVLHRLENRRRHNKSRKLRIQALTRKLVIMKKKQQKIKNGAYKRLVKFQIKANLSIAPKVEVDAKQVPKAAPAAEPSRGRGRGPAKRSKTSKGSKKAPAPPRRRRRFLPRPYTVTIEPKKQLLGMSVEETAKWLEENGLSKLIPSFKELNVTGADLFKDEDLSPQVIKERFGIARFGLQRNLATKIKAAKEQTAKDQQLFEKTKSFMQRTMIQKLQEKKKKKAAQPPRARAIAAPHRYSKGARIPYFPHPMPQHPMQHHARPPMNGYPHYPPPYNAPYYPPPAPHHYGYSREPRYPYGYYY